MAKRDYYEILGVGKNATEGEIKKAFRQKARELHPDVNKADHAEEQFKELGEAYEVLSDVQKRQIYDTYGHDGLQGGGYQPSWNSANFSEAFPDLNDLFSAFFGGGFGGFSQQRHSGPQQGEHLRYDIELTFMEAAFGCEKEIKMPKLVQCDTCEGSGAASGSGPKPCQTCGGGGQVRHTTQTLLGHFTQITTCPTCQGRGQVITDPCKSCRGQGKVEAEKTLNITIPAGVDTGTRLRVAGEGNIGQLGAPSGDLYIIMHVAKHPQFEREGFDIITGIKVSYPQLALGDTIEIPGLKGNHSLKIPAGTQHGQVFTIKHEGIPVLNNNKQRGHLHVQVQLDIPKKLSNESKKLLEQLHQLEKQATATKAESNKNGHTNENIFNRFKAGFA